MELEGEDGGFLVDQQGCLTPSDMRAQVSILAMIDPEFDANTVVSSP